MGKAADLIVISDKPNQVIEDIKNDEFVFVMELATTAGFMGSGKRLGCQTLMEIV
jgi:uncharacterized protein YaaQ